MMVQAAMECRRRRPRGHWLFLPQAVMPVLMQTRSGGTVMGVMEPSKLSTISHSPCTLLCRAEMQRCAKKSGESGSNLLLLRQSACTLAGAHRGAVADQRRMSLAMRQAAKMKQQTALFV